MTKEEKTLPDNIQTPDNSILSKDTYRKIYAVISKETEYNKLEELYANTKNLDELWETTEYQTLIDVGLASRKSGAGEPYIQITSLGKTIVENGVDAGIQQLITGEYNAIEKYKR